MAKEIRLQCTCEKLHLAKSAKIDKVEALCSSQKLILK